MFSVTSAHAAPPSRVTGTLPSSAIRFLCSDAAVRMVDVVVLRWAGRKSCDFGRIQHENNWN
jgi:hypothetical protein